MYALLATAHMWRGGDGPFTLAPLVGLLVSLALVRIVLRWNIGLGALAVSVALGALFATFGDRLGFSLTTACWFLAFALVATIVRTARRPLRRNPSD
jgi:hypothetical protein